ncbi:MAG: FkbM family methyltransferase [Sphingobacteriales bacterium]|nr:MAG: FkbM family methyltransferase [Sphingobacteriales bacterium]
MKKNQKLKLQLSRNWILPFKERITKYLVIPGSEKTYQKGITYTQNGILVSFDTRNYIEYKIFAEGYYEQEVTLLMKNYVELGDTVLDIGANIGVHSLNLSKMVGKSGSVYSFEPIPFLRDKLNRNISLNRFSNINIMPFALSDSNYTIKTAFSQNGNNGTFFIQNDDSGETEINCVKGDDWANQQQITNLKLIKIDVEGFEYKVITGLKETINKYKPVIFFEYDTNYISRANSSPADFNHLFFNEFKYKLYSIQKFILTPITDFSQINDMVEVLALPE